MSRAASSKTPPSNQNIELRHCKEIAEFQACVDLQRDVWSFADADLIPVRMFVVASKIGGQVIGAFDGSVLVGFALSIPGARSGHTYLHSHMLAVTEKYRNSGLGRRLKLAQRDEALTRGFELMEWTFDPLEIKNAYLNIEKLGAIVRRYTLNQYGMSSSPLQGGLPTDRCVAEWWLNSKRVHDLIEEGRQTVVDPEETITVPAQIYEWKADPANRERARELQLANRHHFLNAFSSGLAVLGYVRDEQGNGRYLLARPQERFEFSSEIEQEAEPSCR
ncbi:MAG TPA: GNAT family N-acetyltransferase [Terriglobales bacterium]|nr:GNAT family N-acetyltransferase [Terriglobales bacterium]